MPLERRNKNDSGIVKIHNRVIGSIASFAAKEIKGIVGMATAPIRNFLDVFRKEPSLRGVKLDFGDNNEVSIRLYIIAEYGSNVPYIATLVQENVKKRVEELAGLVVNEVEVNICDVALKG